MKQINFLFIIILTVFITSCNYKKNTEKTSITVNHFKKEADRKYFTILQLNDVYEISSVQGGNFGGMARVETVHQNLLKENENTMLVMAGDFLNPSLIGTMKVDGSRVRGKQMVEVMNAMSFDLVAFGNHEFDLSYTNLQQRLNESKFDWISANVLHNKGNQKEYFKKNNIPLQDSFIKEFKNVDGTSFKVGFISACIPSNPKSYVYYGDIYKQIKRAYEEIKNKVDVVVGLTHLTIKQDKKVAELLPNISLIMGGHEHTNSYNKIGKVIITKADANAKTVYIHRFEYDPRTKKVKVKSELKEINNQIISDRRVEVIVDKWQKVLKNKIKDIVSNPYEIIYKAVKPLDAQEASIRSIQTNMGEVITKAMSFAYEGKVDCALVNGGSVRIDDKLEGDINVVDIFRVLPYGGAVLKVNIKGYLLNDVLEYGYKAAGNGAYLQRYNASRVGDKWMIGEKLIKDDKIYKVAFSDFLLKGLDIPILSEKSEGIVSVYKPNSSELSYDIRKAVINYLKKQ